MDNQAEIPIEDEEETKQQTLEEMKESARFIGVYNYTVILTYIAVPAVIIGLFAAFCSHFYTALICMMIAGLCDAFDGKVARTRICSTPAEKKFGIQIDSLVDLVSYGVMPAMIGLALIQENGKSVVEEPVIYVCVYAFYVLAAIIRLAFFNVTEEERQESEGGSRRYYKGLPVTSASLIVPLLFILFKVIDRPLFVGLYSALLLVVGLLFITNFKLRKPGLKMIIFMACFGVAEAVALLLTYLLIE